MTKVSMLVTILGAVTLGLAGTASAQGNAGFADDSPMSQFTEDDFAMMNANNKAALDGGEAGKKKTWRNAATGATGSITLLEKSEYQNLPCWRAKFTNQSSDYQSTSVYRLCKTAKGEWKVAP